jgi:site-specific DNA-methyltransferase (adenine-specific)
MKEVPVIRLDHLTDEQRKEYAIIHNKTAELSEWDFDLLAEDIPTLDFSDFDIDWGLPEEPEEEQEIVEDETPELPEEPKAKLGDLYILGNHRLLCGDSTDSAVIDRLMDGVKADCVFTDPPYGYNYQSNWRTKIEKFDILENDDKTLNFFGSIKNSIDGFVYVCTTWKVADKWIELFKKYYDLTNVIIWDKGGGGIGDLFHTFSTDYEMILVSNNGHELRGKRYGSVWNFTNTEISKMKKDELLKIVLEQKEYYSIWKQRKDNPNEYVHPTQKPVALSARAIRSSTDFENIVLDLFGGSGSTLIACEQLGRKCYMAELDPRYVDVIIDRWQTFTGEKAVLISE